MLDNPPQTVAVRDDQQLVGHFQVRKDRALPVRHDPFDRLFQGFGARQFPVRNQPVARVETRVARIVLGERIGCDVVAASPDEHLLVAVFGGCLALVESLQHTVMLFVQPPALFDRDPVLVELVQHAVERFDGAFKVRSIGFVECETLFFQQFAGPVGFGDAFFGQVDVRPAGKAVFPVPGAFSVSEQNDFFHSLMRFDFPCRTRLQAGVPCPCGGCAALRRRDAPDIGSVQIVCNNLRPRCFKE